jgi:hypothetical protein
LVGTRKSTKENAKYSAEEDRRGELDIPAKDGSKGKLEEHWFNFCPVERYHSSIMPCIKRNYQQKLSLRLRALRKSTQCPYISNVMRAL